jgi:hypothetical protein
MDGVRTHLFHRNAIAIGKLPQGERSLPATDRTGILRALSQSVNWRRSLE